MLLNIIFRDLHEFTTAATVNEILSGTLNGTRITDGLLLIGATLVEVPIVMVVLSRLLGRRANRAANFAAVFAAIELAGLASITWLVWRWRTP